MTYASSRIDLIWSARLRERLADRTVALVLTLLIEALLILAILSLSAASEKPQRRVGDSLVSLAFDADKPAQRAAKAAAKAPNSAPSAQKALTTPVTPTPQTASPQPRPVVTPSAAPRPLLNLVGGSLDISKLPRTPASSGPTKKMFGPPGSGASSGDSKRVGTAPNGQPMYAAAWYREPYPDELAGYLSTADGPGWALIACRTAPDWRVEDCVALDEYPNGSNMARAVLAASWQFRVRPPQLGGAYKIGEWVRIRIDYSNRQRR